MGRVGKVPEGGEGFVINVCTFLEKHLRAESIRAQSMRKLGSNCRMKNTRTDVWK